MVDGIDAVHGFIDVVGFDEGPFDKLDTKWFELLRPRILRPDQTAYRVPGRDESCGDV